MEFTDVSWLKGRAVAFTGRLGTMTRAEAAALVTALGGEFAPAVNRQTEFLVVGQDGLPLTKKGRLTNKLKRARQLRRNGKPLILAEEDFFERLGLADRSDTVRRRYAMGQLCRLLGLPRDRLRSWLRAGLIKPVETLHGVRFFDFQQVTGVKTLCELTQAGVKAEQIRRSLEQLGRWLPGQEQPLAQLAALEGNGQMLVRLEEGQLAEPSGQLQLDFGADAGQQDSGEHDGPVAFDGPPVRNPEQWWEIGCGAEEAGRFGAAVHAYRQALYLGGPDARLCFNLGNALHALGHFGQAAERFRQAVELDHAFAEAWNNLGNTLVELDQMRDAVEAFQRSLEAQPLYADAHYNLADTLDEMGRYARAREHWRAYVRLEPTGAWADYARRRLVAAG